MRKILFCIAMMIISCQNKEQKISSFILPPVIYEQEQITIYAIEDSLNIVLTEPLFFQIDVWMQDFSRTKGYVEIKDGKGDFTIPKGASYIRGNFYTVKDVEEKKYERIIYNKKTGKEVINAYQNQTSKKMMKKELSNYPNNLAIYAKYIQNQHEQVYLGTLSDSLFQIEVRKYLEITEQQVSDEKASDMYALVVLNTYAKKYDKAEVLLLEMIKKHSNSNFLKESYTSYWVWSEKYREHPKKTIQFIDFLDDYVAKNIPHTPLGIRNSLAPVKMKYYTPEIIARNAQYQLKNVDSTNYLTRKQYIRAKIKLDSKDIKEARKLTLKLLEEAKTEKWKIYNPMKSGGRNGFANTGSEIGFAYHLLAEVSQAEKDDNQAIKYVDSAYMSYQTDRQNNFIKNPITEALNLKASIQRKINKQNEALKTYETLYQETKDDRVLDSIKVLFKETEQEKGFESYAKNLKERVENGNKEPKKLAADFSIKDMSGYEIKLSEWKGRVVVLNFWANYCLPCAKEIPFLNQIWRETQTKDIIFLAVTDDLPLVVQRFAQRQKEMFSFSILPNAKQLADVYDVHLVPTTIVINKKGEIIHRESGFGGNIDKLKQVVLEELAK